MGSNPVQKVNWQLKVNLQLLKYLQLPLRRSNLHLNLYFRSSHHLSKEDLYGFRCNFTLVALFYFALNNTNKCETCLEYAVRFPAITRNFFRLIFV